MRKLAKQLFDDMDLEVENHKHNQNQVRKTILYLINKLYKSKKNSKRPIYLS